MALLTQGPKGTQDFLPEVTPKLQYLESTLLQTANLFGFVEQRTPTFEHTELFVRSVGDTTDVVQKEMYTFEDKKGRSITLKPEGTAGAIRSALEHGLLNGPMPLKVSYLTPCFRYEKQQAGRYREFHQFGVEMLGAASPAADAEIIGLGCECLDALGIQDISLEINSIGCPECRPKFHAALRGYFGKHTDKLCPTCLERLEKNPLRILDCKDPSCHEVAKDAPVVLDYLCDDCRDHFDSLKKRLDAMGVAYTVNPTIVRGLDYYTKTVFEFVSNRIGAQGTVCGGGRYDGLVEVMGGQPTPGIGFAMGIERLYMVMEAGGSPFPPQITCDIYIATMGEEASIQASKMTAQLRSEGFYAETDTVGRSLKAQMKYADKIGAKYTLVLGEEELRKNAAQIKNMKTGVFIDVTLENFVDKLYEAVLESSYIEIAEGQTLEF